jgi:O-acetyl-ADP-ribose deacetylase (regulator of RNase III)
MTSFQWTTLSCAVVSLAIGLPLALADRTRPGVPQPRVRLVLAWLVVALCPVFLIFLFFPESTIAPEFTWGKATGAIAAYLVVWGVGIRYSLQADDLEMRERELSRRESDAASRDPDSTEPIRCGDVLVYELVDRPGGSIGLVAGGLDLVTFADVWVSSENVEMQMARYYDRSVSGVIRYLGGRHDSAGEVVEDVIGRALAARMDGRRSVPLGTVFDTEPGDLAESHRVKRVLHVAAAVGEFGRGYGPAGDIGGCVRAVLRCAERLAEQADDIRSVLLPLLGSGSARGSLDAIVPAVLDTVADHLESHPAGRVDRVYLIAYTKGEHAMCRRILDDDPRLQPGRQVKRAALVPTPSSTTRR